MVPPAPAQPKPGPAVIAVAGVGGGQGGRVPVGGDDRGAGERHVGDRGFGHLFGSRRLLWGPLGAAMRGPCFWPCGSARAGARRPAGPRRPVWSRRTLAAVRHALAGAGGIPSPAPVPGPAWASWACASAADPGLGRRGGAPAAAAGEQERCRHHERRAEPGARGLGKWC